MAFRVPLFDRSTTVSDEGFRVTFVSWSFLRYQAGDLSLDFYCEAGGGGVIIEQSSIKRINPEASRYLNAEQEKVILSNIIDALEWRGWTVQVVA